MKIEKIFLPILCVLLLVAIVALFKVEARFASFIPKYDRGLDRFASFIPKYDRGLESFLEAKKKLAPIADMGSSMLANGMRKGVLESKAEIKNFSIISASVAEGEKNEEKKFLVKLKYSGEEVICSIEVKIYFYNKDKKVIDVTSGMLMGIHALERNEETTGYLTYGNIRGQNVKNFDSFEIEILSLKIYKFPAKTGSTGINQI